MSNKQLKDKYIKKYECGCLWRNDGVIKELIKSCRTHNETLSTYNGTGGYY